MNRRKFVMLLGGTAAALPLAAAAQTNKAPRIGILVLGHPDPSTFLKEFREGLRELGYVEGQSIVFEFRTAKGVDTQLAPLARELVAHKVDIIVAYQTPAVTAAKQATTEISIVMGMAGDPVGTGLIASLARPSGNITGITGATSELGGKNVELIREAMPAARRVAVLAHEPDPFHKPFVENIVTSGKTLGIEIMPLLVRTLRTSTARSPRWWRTAWTRSSCSPAYRTRVQRRWRSGGALPPLRPIRIFRRLVS